MEPKKKATFLYRFLNEETKPGNDTKFNHLIQILASDDGTVYGTYNKLSDLN